MRATACLVPNNYQQRKRGSSAETAELPLLTQMDIVQELKKKGFNRVEVLDGAACGIAERRLLLCFALYEADSDADEEREAVIHAYYPVSQRAYRAAREVAAQCSEAGIPMRQADEVRLKPLMNRLPFLRRGKNTLAYLPEQGSRFHVQALATEAELAVTAVPEKTAHPVACGACRRCLDSCPGGAIREDGFKKEKCLRFWMMNGKVPPKELAVRMGNRLMGCDACESCCPMNSKGTGRPETVPLADLLDGKNLDDLGEKIGRNYAIPNRVITQACLIAGSLGRTDLAEKLAEKQKESASPAVRQAAALALLEIDPRNGE